MYKAFLSFIFISFGMASCIDPISFQDPDMIRWRELNVNSAKKLLTKKVPLNTPLDSVKSFLQQQKLSASRLAAKPKGAGFYISASTPIMREDILMKSKWLLKFHFDKHRRLTKIDVKKGLISL